MIGLIVILSFSALLKPDETAWQEQKFAIFLYHFSSQEPGEKSAMHMHACKSAEIADGRIMTQKIFYLSRSYLLIKLYYRLLESIDNYRK